MLEQEISQVDIFSATQSYDGTTQNKKLEKRRLKLKTLPLKTISVGSLVLIFHESLSLTQRFLTDLLLLTHNP